MGQLYRWLGLTTGVIVNGINDAERQAAYGADITYGQNNELGFDYLRDNMKYDLSRYASAAPTRSSTRWTQSSSTNRGRPHHQWLG